MKRSFKTVSERIDLLDVLENLLNEFYGSSVKNWLRDMGFRSMKQQLHLVQDMIEGINNWKKELEEELDQE